MTRIKHRMFKNIAILLFVIGSMYIVVGKGVDTSGKNYSFVDVQTP